MFTHDPDKLQRLLDYHLGLDEPEGRRETESMLASDPEMQKLDVTVKRTLGPLDSWPDEECPADLADRTMRFIDLHERLGIGDKSHQGQADSKRGRWILSNFREVAAIAACLLIVAIIAPPGARYARQRSRQAVCSSQLARLGSAIGEYANNNQGFLPHVEHQPGATWWNVGRQDQINTSNTRNIFLLVKQGYVPPELFLCPDSPYRKRRPKSYSSDAIRAMHDFAGRGDVNYSFRLMFNRHQLRLSNMARQPFMADQNPLFAAFDIEKQKALDISANDGWLLRVNSPNHNARGQNVLFGDGNVEFKSHRNIDITMDDIFTINRADIYYGNEIPESDDDVFIAP